MIELTSETFEEEVLNADGPVFVDYYGESCTPCKALQPKLEKLEERYAGAVKFTAVNTSREFQLAVQQRILGAPTLVLYQNGEKVCSLLAGNATAENLEVLLQEQIHS